MLYKRKTIITLSVSYSFQEQESYTVLIFWNFVHFALVKSKCPQDKRVIISSPISLSLIPQESTFSYHLLMEQ